MNRTLLIGVAVLGCSAIAAAKGNAAFDDKGSAELKAVMEKWIDAWNKQDAASLKAPLADEMWGAWDVDMAMQPAIWPSRAEFGKFFDESMAMMKKMGASASVKTTKLECKASGALGVCFWEGDQTFAMPKMPPVTVSIHNTEVFAKEKGAWKIAHHHGAVAKEPPMPPHMMALSPRSAAGWTEAGPDMPGIKMIPIWMNPATMTSAGLMKATQTVKQPRHIHPYPFTFAVLEGSIVTSDASGKDVEYGPGSVVYRAANEPHQTTIKQGAVVFSVMSGPMGYIPVDEKGQPIHTAEK